MQKIRILHIRQITVHSREHEDKFIKLMIKRSEKHFNRQPHDNHKELKQTKKNRITKLDTIVQKLYEDNLDSKISDEHFVRISVTYDSEQKQLEQKKKIELQGFIDKSKNKH